MINPTSNHHPQNSVITASAQSGLSAHTLDGRPLRFALIDEHGNVVEAGPAVADNAWRTSVLAHENYLAGQGHLRVHSSSPGTGVAAAPALAA